MSQENQQMGQPQVGSDALLGAIADLLECFGNMEGTWFQRSWRDFGISEEMEAIIEQAWDTKYGHKVSSPNMNYPDQNSR